MALHTAVCERKDILNSSPAGLHLGATACPSRLSVPVGLSPRLKRISGQAGGSKLSRHKRGGYRIGVPDSSHQRMRSRSLDPESNCFIR